MSYSPRTVDKLNELAKEQKGIVLKSLKEVLDQPRYKNTGKGFDSIKVDIIPCTPTSSPSIQITIADHMVMLNRGKMQWTKMPNMDNMLEWAKTKDSDPKKAKRLAWAVGWSKKKFDVWKPKKWRKKSLSEVLKELNRQLKLVFKEAIEEEANQQLEENYKPIN